MKIEFATVVCSINLTNIEVPDGATDDEKREIIFKRADEFFPCAELHLNKPLIHDCSDEELIER